jgi:Icc protein
VLEVIHISDTHLGPDRSESIRGADPCARAEALVAAIRALPFAPDFVVHTGDVANAPDPAAYALAAKVLAGLPGPVYYAGGNHDDIAMMREALDFGPLERLLPDSADRLCYRIAGAAGERMDCFVLDGRVPEDEGPHGRLTEAEIEAVLGRIDAGTKPVAIFLHYPPGPVASPWIDEHLLLRNGPAFLEALRERAGDRLRGVFFGHLHRGLSLFSHGVFQCGVSSPACEFAAGPFDKTCDFLPGGPIPFHHLSFTAKGTYVKAYSIPYPPENGYPPAP